LGKISNPTAGTTRPGSQYAQTRQDILAAAHRLFLERGYAGTTLAAIVTAAADPELAQLWA
jgi:AcrR family transcriptional regulator